LANKTFVQLTDANIPKSNPNKFIIFEHPIKSGILDENLKFVFGDDEQIVPVQEVFIVNGNGRRAYSSKM
jgi:hypothetical protein